MVHPVSDYINTTLSSMGSAIDDAICFVTENKASALGLKDRPYVVAALPGAAYVALSLTANTLRAASGISKNFMWPGEGNKQIASAKTNLRSDIKIGTALIALGVATPLAGDFIDKFNALKDSQHSVFNDPFRNFGVKIPARMSNLERAARAGQAVLEKALNDAEPTVVFLKDKGVELMKAAVENSKYGVNVVREKGKSALISGLQSGSSLLNQGGAALENAAKQLEVPAAV